MTSRVQRTIPGLEATFGALPNVEPKYLSSFVLPTVSVEPMLEGRPDITQTQAQQAAAGGASGTATLTVPEGEKWLLHYLGLNIDPSAVASYAVLSITFSGLGPMGVLPGVVASTANLSTLAGMVFPRPLVLSPGDAVGATLRNNNAGAINITVVAAYRRVALV